MLTSKSYKNDHFSHHVVVELKVNSIHLTAQIHECIHDI